MSNNILDVSVVVPLYNEEESLPELMAWIERVCSQNNLSYEVVMVDDGSTDASWSVVEQLKEKYGDRLKAIRFARNYGKSAALYCGFEAAEEVNLSFETSGKITDIFFKEGTQVSKGDLLAKINDAPLQAELKKLESQLKLYTDRLYRQNALLEKEAVSQEAFQEAQTNLATDFLPIITMQ